MTSITPLATQLCRLLHERDYDYQPVPVASITHPRMITTGLVNIPHLPCLTFAVADPSPFYLVFDGDDFVLETDLDRLPVNFPEFEVIGPSDYVGPPRTNTPWASISPALALLAPQEEVDQE